MTDFHRFSGAEILVSSNTYDELEYESLTPRRGVCLSPENQNEIRGATGLA